MKICHSCFKILFFEGHFKMLFLIYIFDRWEVDIFVLKDNLIIL